MSDKISRNDPCPCGSGKKYKQCCIHKKMQRKKISAVWVNKPKQQETEQNISQDNKEMPNFDAMERSLIERTFGTAIQAAEQAEPSLPIKEHKITVKDEG